jgi:hypothetical protein
MMSLLMRCSIGNSNVRALKSAARRLLLEVKRVPEPRVEGIRENHHGATLLQGDGVIPREVNRVHE